MSDFQRKIHRDRMLRDMQLPSKIPGDMAGVYYNIPVYSDCLIKEPWARVTLIVYATDSEQGRKSSAHRVFVKCPCMQEIPAGRYHQHAPSCDRSIAVNIMAVYERIIGYRTAGRTWLECQRYHPEPWIVVEVINQLSEADRQRLRDGINFATFAVQAQ